ncbi:four-carbon acid sugar kinase family protein [Peteryoungia ipomoeae]|uniref:four-carbon acid sugar kinase family protein n=1 Tax=Peteryoungia ipomoeae TaxID=1210932 RepID=UPI0014562987|nr:four-carbon acid sugar kinase family protein [Peteryoungia ipomoeae]
MLVIIADDLTGALDTAAPFAARGLHTQVALTADAVPAGLLHKPDVLSINLASREMSPADALRLMLKAVGALPPDVTLFKKIDSRLKGHVAAELDGIDYRRALVAPAIPSFGRFVRGGHVEGFGVAKPISVIDALEHHAVRCDIADALTDQDLHKALAHAEQERIDLLVGARGLAEALAVKMTGKEQANLVAPPTGPALFVIGSHDNITLEQADRMRSLEGLCYRPAPNGVSEPVDLQQMPIVLLQATPGDTDVAAEKVAQNLALSAHPELTHAARTLLLCGGATAEAVLSRMGIKCFRLQGECLPGLGLAYAGEQCIIAKSGGFGEPDTLLTLAKRLLGGRG